MLLSIIIGKEIPLWGIIATLITLGVPIIWGIISMHFGQKANETMFINLKNSVDTQMEDFKDTHNKEITTIKQDMHSQEKAISTFKKDIEEKLDKHKLATDIKLGTIGESVVRTETLVRLLVDNKLK